MGHVRLEISIFTEEEEEEDGGGEGGRMSADTIDAIYRREEPNELPLCRERARSSRMETNRLISGSVPPRAPACLNAARDK